MDQPGSKFSHWGQHWHQLSENIKCHLLAFRGKYLSCQIQAVLWKEMSSGHLCVGCYSRCENVSVLWGKPGHHNRFPSISNNKNCCGINCPLLPCKHIRRENKNRSRVCSASGTSTQAGGTGDPWAASWPQPRGWPPKPSLPQQFARKKLWLR